MKTSFYIILTFLTCFLAGCYTQKHVEAYARANPVAHVSSNYSMIGNETALLGREQLIGKWQAVSHVDWAMYGCAFWGVWKRDNAFDATVVYDFKDDGRVDINVGVSIERQRCIATAKGKWTYGNGILKIRLGEEKWDGRDFVWFKYVAMGMMSSELELQKDFWGNRNDRVVAWYGENTISLRWSDVQNYQRWWENFMRDYLWNRTKSVTVAQIGDDGCWHVHSAIEDTRQPGMRLIDAVGDRLVFRRVSPRMDEDRQQDKKEVLPKDVTASPNIPPYRVINLVRQKGNDFAYTFSLELPGDTSIQTFFGVQNIFANEVRTAYQMEYPNADMSSLRVVVQPSLSNGRIVGRAEVLTIVPVALSYDASARLGKLSVRFNANQYEEARVWARKNIETLARDKNIALVSGEIPPAARFYSLGESLKDGNILEIEFKTE